MRLTWTAEDDELLFLSLHEKGRSWREIAQKAFDGSRSEDAVRNRYERLQTRSQISDLPKRENKSINTHTKRKWSVEESQMLTEMVLGSFKKKWKYISTNLDRDVQGVRNRWSRMLLVPDMCKDVYLTSSEQIELLLPDI